MSLFELFVIAIALSMDAFAVAICKGLSLQLITAKKALTVGLYFGIFQAVMPLTGYFLGTQLAGQITAYDHWIAFVLLALIGLNMIRHSVGEDDCEEVNSSLSPATMLPLAVATSVDALAVGFSLALLQVRIVPAVLFIGIITLVLSMAGVKIGNLLGARYKSKAELAGGVLLVLMGVKILLEHLEIIRF